MTSEQKEKRPIKIVADKDIPFLQGALEPYTEIIYKKGMTSAGKTSWMRMP